MSLEDIRTEIVGLHSDDPLAGLLHHAGEALGEPTSARLTSRITVQTYQLARALVEAGASVYHQAEDGIRPRCLAGEQGHV